MDLSSISPLLETVSEGLLAVAPDLSILSANKAAEDILGPGCEGLIKVPSLPMKSSGPQTRNLKQTISAVRPFVLDEGPLIPLGTFLGDEKTPVSELELPVVKALMGKNVENYEIVVRNQSKPDGVRLSVNARAIKDAQGKLLYILCAFKDISAAHVSEQRHNIFRQVFAQTQEAIVITDGAFYVQYANQAYWDLTGNTPEKVLNRPFSPQQEELNEGSSWSQMKAIVASDGRWSGEFVVRKKSNELLPLWATLHAVVDADRKITNYVLTLADLTSLKSTQEELYRLVSKDPVTGLSNRRSFFEQLDRIIEKSTRQNRTFALFFIDLQRFKELNDSLGHQAGDKVLQEVGSRLSQLRRQDDAIARLGGDEFAIVAADCASELEIALAIEQIRAAIESPIAMQDHSFTPSICIGAAVFPEDGLDAATLAKNADTALTAATSDGEANTQLYTKKMNSNISRHFWVENNLRNSFGKKQLIPYFQPQLNLSNDKPEEAEILIRWQHPESGLISPGEFIPVAERTGLISKVTTEVMEASCKLLVDWKARGLPLSCLALNVSANLLLDTEFVNGLYWLIEAHDLSPKDILIEITESSAMLDPNQTSSVLKQMKDYGLTLAIDDFGTGYSSLAYLHKFSVDQIKIDQSFVKNLETAQESRSIVKAIIRMCEALGFEALAEGVETKGQAAILRELGCKKLQGYLIAKPLSATEFEAFMEKHGEGMSLH